MIVSRRWFLLPLSALLLSAGVVAMSQEGIHYDDPPKKLPEVNMLLAGEKFDIEVTMTQAQMLRGLMYRTSLPEKHGMLFPFYPPRAVTFWMKNTRIPLDMIFIRNKIIVNIVHSAPPCVKDPCPTFDSVVPVDMVVELAGGTAEHLNIDVGDIVQFESKNSPESPEGQTHDPGKPVDVFPVDSPPASSPDSTP